MPEIILSISPPIMQDSRDGLYTSKREMACRKHTESQLVAELSSFPRLRKINVLSLHLSILEFEKEYCNLYKNAYYENDMTE